MARTTGNDDWRTLRPPLMPLDRATADALWTELAATDLSTDLAA